MALPNTGITSTMVANKIGASSRKWSVLCSHPNINKWSKWKPVHYNTQQPLTLAQLEATNYGLIVPTPSANYASVVSAGWKYNKPTGTSTSPYRIGDFRNYYHNSVAPMAVQEDISMLDGQQALPISAIITTETNPNSIGISDLTDGTVGAFGNYYYGVVVTSGATAVMQTASTTIANGGTDFVLNSTHAVFSGTNIKAYHIFSNSRVDTLTPVASVNGVKFIPIPSAPNKSNISNITVNPAIDMDVIITGIGTKADGALYNSPSYYSAIGGRSLPTMGAVYLQLEIINHSPSPQFFTSTALTMGANPTYFGSNTNTFPAKLYTNAGVERPSIEVPGTASGGLLRRFYVRVGLEDVLNRDGRTAVSPLPINIQGNTIITSFGVYKSGINIASVAGISAQARAVL